MSDYELPENEVVLEAHEVQQEDYVQDEGSWESSFNDVEEVTAGEEEEPSITEVTVEQPGSTVDMEGDEEPIL